ncbi:carbonic anhydrase [Phlyctochytrium arcticum]|nr:carbonic anhydrase [Phlyctochytrium arcticum]
MLTEQDQAVIAAAQKREEAPKTEVPRLDHLLANNKIWAAQRFAQFPELYGKLAQGQAPEIMYIGCSDSRVPPTEIVGLGAGDLFVHRNIANTFVTADLNLLSVLQFAVENLKVKHIVVCGHYNCGGVHAALSDVDLGLIDNWLQPIKDFYHQHRKKVDAAPTQLQKVDVMCELNVLRTARGVAHTTIVRNAWKRGQDLTIHTWCYRLSDAQASNRYTSSSDLKMDVNKFSDLNPLFEKLVAEKTLPAYLDE